MKTLWSAILLSLVVTTCWATDTPPPPTPAAPSATTPATKSAEVKAANANKAADSKATEAKAADMMNAKEPKPADAKARERTSNAVKSGYHKSVKTVKKTAHTMKKNGRRGPCTKAAKSMQQCHAT
ncbi:MAG TPA: hypothetical protein VIE69_10680 [Methylophilaceae bacterium]|jgi:hypothetical protein